MVTANGTENPTVSYGDQIRFTFHAQPKKTGGNRKNYALQPNEVAFYCGKELLGKTRVNTQNEAVLVYRTTDRKIPIGESTITAEFGGRDRR